jgi:hypothetical protein
MANGDPTILYGFNATSPSAVRNARRYAAARVTEVGEETIAALRAVVLRGFRENIPPRELARIIAGRAKGATPMIGLHSRQAAAALNYREGLKAAGLQPSTISRLMGTYVRRKRMERALNIARTETMTSLNHGRNAQFNTARRKGLIRKDAGKEWIITPDERLCKLCAPMAGIVVRVDKEFETARGSVKAPPLHPSCRCTIGLKPIPGGKRLSPIPQPGAPPVFPLPTPKAPPAPPAPKPSTKASATPQPPVTGPPAPAMTETVDFAPGIDLSNPDTIGIDVISRGRLRGWPKHLQGTGEGITEQLRTEAARHKKTWVRTANVRVSDLFVDNSKALLNTGGDGRVLGWYGYRGLPKGGVHILANQARRQLPDVLEASGLFDLRGIVNRSVQGSFRHEYGHAVWYQTLSPGERARVANLYKSLTSKPAQLANNVKSRLGETLSVYGESKVEEMWAEAYAVYTHPSFKPGTKMLPRRLEELMDELMTSPQQGKGVYELGPPTSKATEFVLSEWGG